MRILLVHNFYGTAAPSGEAAVVEAEQNMLRERGSDVQTLFRYSDDIRGHGIKGVLKGALSTPWNPFSADLVRRKVESVGPDVVHVHNTFPLLSPAIFWAIGQRAARVLTLHNYRLFCPAAIPMREGRVCTECLSRRSVWPAVRHGCYRQSRMATLPLAAGVALHRRLNTWQRQVDAFIALTEFQKELMVESGLQQHKVHVKPNFYPGSPAVVPWPDRRKAVVFVGRLSEEKGVESLTRAWLAWGADAPPLRIVGDGPLREVLEKRATSMKADIRFLGQLPAGVAQEEIARARLLVLPSECFETFGLVLGEAFAFGTPVAVSDIGPLPSIVQHGENGVVFQPADPNSLLTEVRSVWRAAGQLEDMGHAARRSYERLYSEEKNYQLLMDIYDRALAESRKKGRR